VTIINNKKPLGFLEDKEFINSIMAQFSQEVGECARFVDCPNSAAAQVVISTEHGCKGSTGKRMVKLHVGFLDIPIQSKLVLGDCKR